MKPGHSFTIEPMINAGKINKLGVAVYIYFLKVTNFC
jgi:methionine aminopeptidase